MHIAINNESTTGTRIESDSIRICNITWNIFSISMNERVDEWMNEWIN